MTVAPISRSLTLPLPFLKAVSRSCMRVDRFSRSGQLLGTARGSQRPPRIMPPAVSGVIIQLCCSNPAATSPDMASLSGSFTCARRP